MKLPESKGKRIKPTDKDLVFHTALALIVPLFMGLMLLLNLDILLKLDYTALLRFDISGLKLPIFRLVLSGLLSAAACLGLVLFVKMRFTEQIEQLFHRQKLARMLIENKWYESGQSENAGWFKDTKGTKKDVIAYFPKMYYKIKDGYIHVLVEVVMGSYGEQLAHLEKKLEMGLYCELISRELHNGFYEYVLLFDMKKNRIPISEVKAQDGKLRLMKNIWWAYDTLPHMLIAGGTGGGKTYFILTLIEAILKQSATLYVLDPKNADLADLGTVLPNVYHKKEDIVSCISKFCEEMHERSETMKQMSGYKTGENYAYIGLAPQFLIFDEYVAFMEMLNNKEREDVLNKLKQIVMLGRQAGFFLILACQRPDAKYLGDGIRDQFNFRVALGRMSELGYSMMFGETNKEFFFKNIKGRGYADTGMGVITEFYTPIVPKGYDFLQEIGALSCRNLGNYHVPIADIAP